MGKPKKKHKKQISKELQELPNIPVDSEVQGGRTGFWARVGSDYAILYYADGYTDYIFNAEKGWEKFNFQPQLGWDMEYDKVSEKFALEQAWKFGYNLQKFFAPRPWENADNSAEL